MKSTMRFAFLSGVASLATTPVLAQTPANPQATQNAQASATAPSGAPTADIIVTARRRAESLQKVPMTVTVATGEQLQKLALFDFKDIQQLSPGLELTNNDGRTNVATLRGITFNPDAGTLPAVDVYVNDIPVDAQTAFTAIYDVSQIEVLRGPQGIFRGRTSPAGAITLTTRQPNFQQVEGYAEATGTNHSAFNLQGGASLPIVPGVLALRVAGLVDENHSNQVRDVNLNDRRSRAKTQSGRVSLGLRAGDAYKGVLTYQYLHSDVTPFIAVFGPGNAPLSLLGDPTRTGPAIDLEDRRAVSSTAPVFINRTHLITLDNEVRLTEHLNWSSNIGYQDTLLRQRRSEDPTNSVPGYVQEQVVRTPYKVFTVDTRLSSSGNGIFNWMLGGYYTHQTNDVTVAQPADAFVGLPFSPLPASLATKVNVEVGVPGHSTTKSVFGSVRFNLTPQLRLEAGLRYTDFKVHQQSILTVCIPAFAFCPVNNLATISPQNADRTYRPLTGGASLSYDINPDFTTYVAVGRSYRPGSAAVGVTTPGVSQGLLVSKAETSNSVEIGGKASFLNRRLSLSADAFYQKYKNYVDHIDSLNVREANPASPGTTTIGGLPTNSNGNAITKGVEAQLTGRLTNNFDLGASASYVDAHYDNAVLPCNQFDSSGQAVIPAGQEFATCVRNDAIARVPKFSFSANSEYRFQMGSIAPFIRGLINYRPGFNSVNDNYHYRAFTNLNLFAGVRGPHDAWELTAFAKNILDQTRALQVASGQGQTSTTGLDPVTFAPTGLPGAPFLSGYRTAVITTPREFGLIARVKW